jgi:large subunit ribosomal protein L3
MRAPATLTVEARQAEVGMGIYGTKAGMTQIFTDKGLALPATVIAIDEGNIVTQVKTPETDGYAAVQIGYEPVKPKNIRKPEMGHLTKAGAPPLRHLREFKVCFPAGGLTCLKSRVLTNDSTAFLLHASVVDGVELSC